MKTGLLIVAVLLAMSAGSARANEPENRDLVLAGAAMAIPTYVLGVTLHEGAHAVVAKAYGAEITSFNILPRFAPWNDKFYFGWVRYRGYLDRGERTLFLLSPKLVDVTLLAGYSALIAFDALPSNEYAQLAFTVFATGLWVDFSKDIPSTRPTNDLVAIYNLHGIESEWQRLPYRFLQLSISAGAAVAIGIGYSRIFDSETEPAARLMLPIYSGGF